MSSSHSELTFRASRDFKLFHKLLYASREFGLFSEPGSPGFVSASEFPHGSS